MLLRRIAFRKKCRTLGFLIIAMITFVYVTIVSKSLERIKAPSKYFMVFTCNESTSNTHHQPEPSILPTSKIIKEIPRHISNVSEFAYPIMLWNNYLINNPDLCKMNNNILILIVVKTNPLNFERRSIIRDTWSNKAYFFGVIKVLFLMGNAQNETIQENISREFHEYLDILQGDFLDTYKNLTNKGVMGLRWITENCMQAKMIVKVDDDVVLDTYRLLEIVYPIYENKTRYILCNIFMGGKAPIVRDVKHKWYVKDSELKNIGLLDKKIYPPYCSGFTVILATDLIPAMFGIAHVTPFFWVDDVYLHGLLPMKAKRIDYVSLSRNYTFSYKQAMRCFSGKLPCNFLSIGETKLHEMRPLWNMIQTYHSRRIKKNTTRR
ncbi:hypothetical protein CHS0354_011116 [Potamilus streckersoni]|uniref:Hexosyltransferase n=1 Tax=Potamilus streckersoni TaxID=2493646 RepID=A0AAE0TBW8_9BIVA|nr:hypothetical protein CHS0354_011116 [Potamilus streckersoni]